MSKSDPASGYSDPYTSVGVRLSNQEHLTFHLHEVGCQKFSSGWNHQGIKSPYWRLYWNDRAGSWIDCSSRRYELVPSRLLLVPSHTLFDTHSSSNSVTHLWIHFSLHPDLTSKDNLPFVVSSPRTLAQQASALAKKMKAPASHTVSQLHHMCSSLLHGAFIESVLALQPSQLPSKLSTLINEIESSLATPMSVLELSLRAGMSREAFIRWFKKYMKVSPGRYILNRRIDHACRLLKFSSATIEEISEKLAFANRNHFSRVFKTQMGCGPSGFRRN